LAGAVTEAAGAYVAGDWQLCGFLLLDFPLQHFELFLDAHLVVQFDGALIVLGGLLLEAFGQCCAAHGLVQLGAYLVEDVAVGQELEVSA